MAYTLKASGIATNLVMCVAVDSDGTTIKEFVSSDVDTNKTTTGVTTSSATWKGTSRAYFTVSGTFGSPNCVQFPSGHRPAWNVLGPGAAGDGGALFIAMSGSSAGSGGRGFISDDNGAAMLGAASGTVLTLNGAARSGATTPPSDATKWSAGANYAAFTDWQIYYGLESGSLAQDATGTDSGSASTLNITGVGGWAGFTFAPGNYHIAALFNRTLTLTEMQSLHNDWFGTLFDAGGGPVSAALSGSAATPGSGTQSPVFSIGL